jgi:hypothetical protein
MVRPLVSPIYSAREGPRTTEFTVPSVRWVLYLHDLDSEMQDGASKR